MIGLGTMGRNLVYNMCDHGFSVAGFDKDPSKLETLDKERGNYLVYAAPGLGEFISSLKTPRVILLLVPAGIIVDAVIDELKPLLLPDDLVIDCGNSHFTDTERRIVSLAMEKIRFMGVGISGGETGARFGPSIMPGGKKEAYDRVAPMLEGVSAKVGQDACVTYIGPGSSGHYVKMVHNGIEYALMELIAETYDILKEVGGMRNDELHEVFFKWNEGPLQSYLIEITAAIFQQKDDSTSNYLVDMILDSAGQKGTGKWVSQNAMDLQVPVPAIDAAVSARDLSAFKEERMAASGKIRRKPAGLIKDKNGLVKWLGDALYFSMITTFSQGLSLLQHASEEYNYEMKLDEIVKIWRGGCIIRASLLEIIRTALQKDSLPNLMVHEEMAGKLAESEEGIRNVVRTATENGIPVPVFMASLAYYDGYRREWLPSNLVQAQRDLFGAHTYQRTDRQGIFHTEWNQKR